MQGNNPKIRDDCYFNPLYVSKDNGFFVFGSRENDSSILLKQNKIETFKRLIAALDGSNSIDDLVSYGFGSKAEIEKIIELLSRKGLLHNALKSDYFNEADNFSIKLLHFEITIRNEINSLIIRKFADLYKYLLIILLFSILFCYVFISRNNGAFEIIADIQLRYNTIGSSVLLYFLVNIFVIPMFIIHEFFHIFYGLRYGINSFQISCVLFLGFIPMFYVKHKDLYRLNKRALLQVISAGVAGNLGLLLLFAILYLLTNKELYVIFALSNLKIVYSNIIPLTLSDGYFFLSILFKIPNIRLNMYKTLSSPKYFFTLSKKYQICVITTIVSLLIIILFEALWLCLTLKLKHYVLCSIIVLSLSLLIIHKTAKRSMRA